MKVCYTNGSTLDSAYTCCLEDDDPQEWDSIVGPVGVVVLHEGRSAGCLPKQSLYYGLWRSCYSGAESIQILCYSTVQGGTATAYFLHFYSLWSNH